MKSIVLKYVIRTSCNDMTQYLQKSFHHMLNRNYFETDDKKFDNFYEAYTPKNFPISFFRRFLFVNLQHQRKNYQANSSSL